MSARTLKNKGFTLVEILIVVVILGILAAIVIPQFTQASESARASSLKTQLQTIRSQLELYQVQHVGDYPALANLQTGTPDEWTNLVELTNSDGTTTGTPELGPYLQKAPVNAFTSGANGANILGLNAAGTAVAGGTAADAGWAYNATTGEIKAIMDDTKAVDTGLVPTGTAAGADDPDLVLY